MRPGGTAIGILLAISLATVGLVPTAGAQASPEPYHTYDTMKSDVQALAKEHDIAEYREHGTSVGGLEIFSVDVAINVSERSEDELAELPTLYVDGAHHGNELLSAEATYYFLERVLANATEDASYLEGKRLVVTPIVNPDGHVRDARTNAQQVDLNRNYPFHWGLYGTSDVPGMQTYRGPSAASEPETQANIELMKQLNLYGYVSGHTGTYDLVLPWNQDEDGTMPDWGLYETTLGVIENETGLEYRDPSGAGESPAWAYGNRTTFAILPEVDTEQNAPASVQEVEQRLNEVLNVYRIAWENLTHLGGAIHVDDVGSNTVSVYNDGWGSAYNVTTGTDTVDQLAPGENATLTIDEARDAVAYERLAVEGDDPSLAETSAPIGEASTNAGTSEETEDTGVPGPGASLLVLALAGVGLALRRRN